MSKSSIKTKTVLTMTDMTKSTELQAFKRQKDGYKVRQNLLDSDYEIYMVRVKRSDITLLPCVFMTLLAVSINMLRLSITF